MNYLLILIGYKPEYIKYTINAILSTDMDAEIYLCSDLNVNYKNTTYINLQDVHSEYIGTINNLSIYENTIFKKNPLWSTSLRRVFYIYELKKLLGLNKVVHFDNDVIIYKSYSEIENCFVKNTLNITQSNSKKLIFGYSCIENHNVLKQVCDLGLETCLSGNKSNWEENNFKPVNEMQILGSVNSNNPLLFNLLPKISYEAQKNSNNITVAEIIEALDGPISLTSCGDKSDSLCQSSDICFLGGKWNQVNEIIRKSLNNISLDDLLNFDNPFPVEYEKPMLNKTMN